MIIQKERKPTFVLSVREGSGKPVIKNKQKQSTPLEGVNITFSLLFVITKINLPDLSLNQIICR